MPTDIFVHVSDKASQQVPQLEQVSVARDITDEEVLIQVLGSDPNCCGLLCMALMRVC